MSDCPKPSALLFSGHNQRSVVALARYLKNNDIDVCIASSGSDDPIYHTDYSDLVVYERESKKVTVELFNIISRRTNGRPLIYIPTTEYINTFVLRNRPAVEKSGVRILLCDRATYEEVTGKQSSQRLMCDSGPLSTPRMLNWDQCITPCVIKPKQNISSGQALYPIICTDKETLADTLRTIKKSEYFVQEYITGTSYYLCGYLATNGAFDGYWQRNIAQQVGGKSIVFAESCSNPGIETNAVTKKLSCAGFQGPFMVEIIKSGPTPYYIEINPRFWGPLQLGIDYYPSFLDGFLADYFGKQRTSGGNKTPGDHKTYAWFAGATNFDIVALNDFKLPQYKEFKKHDVYNRPDTIRLHGKI
ncbi:hypothetical protein DFR31_2252 [Alkalispirillum mobile]|uniref:ATP-grasp domain-containing protein n=1 Tax=Alkalispirillum mobile TaxID=85925 RepID=A0A498BZI2_9GAMM|nr:hypothetical protein [Alkalispirillum mobile]RLK48373.1 hypothetical protein DFR31_2252 [Alkalispirillum mobile]